VTFIQEAGLVTSPINSDEPNEIFDTLKSGLLSALDAVSPLRPQRVKPHCDTFFFLKKLQKMHRKKRKLEKRFKRTHEPTDLQSVKNVLKLYNRRIRNLKAYFFSKKLVELDTDRKQLIKHQFASKQIGEYCLYKCSLIGVVCGQNS